MIEGVPGRAARWIHEAVRHGFWRPILRLHRLKPRGWVSLWAIGILLFAAFWFGCRSHLQDNRLVVGMELSYPPFEMTDARGTPSGVSVDLAYSLGEYLGRDIVIENIPFDGLIPALKTGKIDVVISSMTATEERRSSIDFSEPYVRTGLSLLVGVQSDIRSIGDVDRPGKTVAVKKGTTGHAYAARHLLSARLLVLDKETACVLEVIQGKADAFIYDQMSIYRNWRRNRETTRPVLEAFQEEFWAMGVRRGNEPLLGRINEFLKVFRQSGGFDRLAERYLAEERETFHRLGTRFIF